MTVTVRVTVSVEQSEGTGEVQPRRKAGREREVEAQWQSGKVQGDGQHCRTGVGPQSVWKHGVREKVALGEMEVERQLHVPCGEPQFEGPQVAR